MSRANNVAVDLLIRAKDNASRTVSGLTKRMGGLSKVVAGVGAAFASYFSVRAIAGFFRSAVDEAASLEQQLSRVGAVTRAVPEDMARLKAAAEEMGASTKFTATEAAQAMEELGRAGLDVDKTLQALPSVLALAAGQSLELAQSADIVAGATAGMQMSFSESARVADVLALAASSAKTDVEGLGTALSYAAPNAVAAGLEIEELAAYIGTLANAGYDGSRSGTALSRMMAAFVNPASGMRQALRDLGITTDDFSTAMEQLEARGDDALPVIVALGERAGPALRTLLGQGIEGVKDLTGRLREAEGAAGAAAERMAGNLRGAMVALGSAWSALKIQLVDPLLEPLAEQVRTLTERIRAAATDGSLDKLKESLLSAFNAGATAVTDFLTSFGSVDEVLERLANGVARTIEVFAKLTAGGKIAANTLIASFRGVQSVVYAVGQVVTTWLSFIMRGVNFAVQGLAKLGLVSKETAAKSAAWVRALEEAGDELRERYTTSVNQAGEAMDRVREGFETLGKSTDDFRPKLRDAGLDAETLARHAHEAATGVFTTAESFEAFAKAQEEQAAAQEESRREIDLATASTAELRDRVREASQRYHDLIAAGAEQEEVATAAGELRDAQRELATAVGEGRDAMLAAQRQAEETEAGLDQVAVSTTAVAGAFEELGVTSQAELEKTAAAAREAFSVVEAAEAPVKDLQAAFLAYAETAIAANKGVADETLRAKAEALGLRAVLNEKFEVVGFKTAEEAAADLKTKLAELRQEAGPSAAAVRNVGSAAAAAADQTEEASTKGRAALAQWFAALLDDGIAITKRWSDATEQLFHKLRGATDQVKEYAKSQRLAAGDIDHLRERQQWLNVAIGETRLAQQKLSNGSFFRWAAKSSQAAYEAESAYIAQRLAMEELLDTVESGELSMRYLDRASQRAAESFDLLDKATLSRLEGAIESARRRMDGLRDSSLDTLRTLQDELLQLQGNEDELARRRLARREAELRAQMAEASAAGDREAMTALQQSLGILQQIGKEEEQQRKAREQERRSEPGPDRARDPGGAPSDYVRHEINVNGRTTHLDLAPGQDGALERLLRDLESAAERAQ